jgi:dipeptide transport system ATP-binding protein
MVPGAFDRPSGCLLSPRCAYVQARCRAERPTLDGDVGAQARCFFPLTQVAA